MSLKMKAKLWIHQKNFSEEEFVINSKDFSDIEVGAVVEIRDPELDLENCSPLLVQAKSFNSQSQQQLKDGAVSVSQAIASIFHLRMYSEVEIRVVKAEDVALDMIELTYKEQYFSRSDMQRMKGSLKNTCLYYTKKVKHVEMRAQVHELWSKGDKVSCGYVTEDTRVTFRSYTAQVNIFIQMSSEMWEFDNYGDLYFEKAVDGFLVDMFNEWKEKGCSHDVTITLFSRTFYESKNIGDFPMYMRECVQRHSSGYFYEDFYRVVVQNEKYEDWTKTLIELRKLFHEYNEKVVTYHEKQGHEGIPSARNSTAAEGNLLEVLNMSLNVFEKFYLDRCFDRTGKLSTVITPGQGVFEVDRKLASITKHRTIDCGSSSDLVCMGEQPLHVVPLFKFTSNSSSTQNDYNIPHWINHSFYTSRSQAEKQNRGVFIPRIKIPQPLISPEQRTDVPGSRRITRINEPSRLPSDEVPFLDYDEYDAQIFKTSTQKPRLCNSYQAVKAMRVLRCSFSESSSGLFDVETTDSIPQSDEDILFMSHSFGGYPAKKKVDVGPLRHVAGSLSDPVKYQRPYKMDYQPRSALFNPFTPSRLRFKVTSNRRRWAHAFPTDSQGDSVQMHHKSNSSLKNPTDSTAVSLTQQGNQLLRSSALMISKRSRPRKRSETSDYGEHFHHRQVIVSSVGSQSSTDSAKDYMRDRTEKESTISFKGDKPSRSDSNVESYNDDTTTPVQSSNRNGISGQIARSSNSSLPPGLYSRSSSIGRETVATTGDKGEGINWVWGLSGEQEWTPEIKTGVDWKSMIIPASLPITTDYFPDSRSLETDYVFKNYTLLPEDINSDSRADKSAQLSPMQVYKEMVTQRIAHGFQIVMSKSAVSGAAAALNSSPYQNSLRRRTKIEPTEEAIVSIGSIFHRLSINGPKINATTYWPRHPYPPMSSHYIYRFQVPDSERYDVSWTDFACSKLENYNWNHVDIYLCTKGEDPNFDLTESLKHWRAHFVLLPCNNHATTKTIIDGVERCDIYEEPSISTQQQLLHGFLRFLEMLNKLRRPIQSHMPAKKEFSRKSSITVSPVVTHPNMERGTDGTGTPKNKSMSRVTEGSETPPFGSYGVSGSNLEGSFRRTPVAMADIPGNPLAKGNTKPEEEIASEEFPFNASSRLDDLVTSMLEPNGGLYFVKQQNQQQQNQFGPSILPNYCFIADEAIAWVKLHVDGMASSNLAVSLLQKMLDEQLICHASGNHGHRFIQGFYLYYFCKEQKGEERPQVWSGYCTNREFEKEWMEVITHCPEEGNGDKRVRPFFQETVLSTGYDVPPLYEKTSHRFRQHESAVYKNVNVVVDPSGKSDRQEWGTGKYHANYTPTSAFELRIKWLVATGCILGDLIQSWSRKAGQYGFHFLPVPGDPFALPFTPGSDPLRGPIFVPLNIDCLKPKHMHLFEDFPPDTRDERLVLFQECILQRFGFIADECPIKTTIHSTLLSESQPKYVHCSGGMFAMIPDTNTTSPRNRDGTHCRSNGGSLKEYIAMQSGLSNSASEGIEQESFYQVGFLWSWNYMLSKRWRSPNTGDEHYQDQMLGDFRAFCSNTDNRLEEYWNMCWQEYEESKQPMVLDQVAFHLENNTSIQHLSEAPKDENTTDVLP